MVAYSDTASRPGFRSQIDVFSTPSSTLETPSSWPLRHPSNPPPTDSCRRSDPVISGMIAIDTCRKPCRDPRRDVDIVFVDASLSTQHVVKPVLNAVPGGPYILKNRAIYTGSHDPGMPKNKVTRLKSFRNHFSGMFHDFSFLDRGNQYILKTSVNDYSP